MADEELKLQLEIESQKAEQEATEALESIEAEVKSLASVFEGVSDSLVDIADQFGTLKSAAEHNLKSVQREGKKATEEFDNIVNSQERGTKGISAGGKVAAAVWKDMGAGLSTLKTSLAEMVGLRGILLGGAGVTGGAIALAFGSFLTVDALNTASKGLAITSSTLMGQFRAMGSRNILPRKF